MENNLINSFILQHFSFNKPSLFKNSLPSCFDITAFQQNTLPKLDDILPYVSYGGMISFDRTVDFDIDTGDYYLCLYVNDGRISLESDSTSCIGEQKLVFVGYKNKIYNIKTISRISSMYVYFVSGKTVDSYIDSIRKTRDSKYFFHREFDMHTFIISSLGKLDELIKAPDETALFTESLIFQYVFVRLLNVQNKVESTEPMAASYVGKLKKILDTRFVEYITLDMLQDELGINKYRLCRDFSSTYNISPLKYLNSVRINTARQMLLDTDNSVVDIGNAVGIPNTTHFIKLFKKETGDTPLKYRQHHATLGDNLPGPYSF